MPKNIYGFDQMAAGTGFQVFGAEPKNGKRSDMHDAFYKYAMRHDWEIATHSNVKEGYIWFVRLK